MKKKNKSNESYFLGRLGKKLFIYLTVIVFVSLVVMMAQGIHCSHRAVKNASQAYLYSIAECKKEHIELWLQERSEDLKVLSKTKCLMFCNSKKNDNIPFCNVVYSVKNRSDAYKNISVYNANGKVLFTTAKNPNFDFSNTELFKDVVYQRNFVYKGIYFDYKNLPLMDMACFIHRNSKSPKILLVQMDITTTLNKVIHHEIGLGESGKIEVLDKQGNLLVSNNNHIHETRMIEQSLKIDPFGIIVRAKVPWHEAMKELFLHIKISIVTAFLTLICMFFFVWKMSKNISEPILRIASAAHNIAEGDLKQRVDYKGKDEIGTLITDFNSMATCLSLNQNSMEKKHQQLQNAYEKIEETKLQLAKIEALAATGKMAASIVHEIRNPLSTIKLNSQILVRRFQNDPKYQEHGRIALNQIQHLENMLTDLLNFSRPISLNKEDILLNNIAKGAIEIVSGELSKRNIKINYEVSPLVVHCDAERLQHAIANILLNAIYASTSQQHIDMRCHSLLKQRKIIIEITDYGKGISSESIENIFEPFFSLRKNGTGLGLSYVKKIVQLHGGTLEVESSLGEGSCFRITIPKKSGDTT